MTEEAQESGPQEGYLVSDEMQDITNQIDNICRQNAQSSEDEEENNPENPTRTVEPEQQNEENTDNVPEQQMDESPELVDTAQEEEQELPPHEGNEEQHEEEEADGDQIPDTQEPNDGVEEDGANEDQIPDIQEPNDGVEEDGANEDQIPDSQEPNDSVEEGESEGMMLGSAEQGLPLADGSEEDEEGFALCEHQATFVNLSNMIPRGFSSTADLPTFKNPENGVSPSESTLKMQQDKWKEIGYDPNHGKGSMKASFTMQNIKGYGMKTVTAHKEVSKFDRLQDMDAESPLKLPKPGGRINSSEGPRVESVMQEEEEEHDGFSEGSEQEEFSDEEEEQFVLGGIDDLLHGSIAGEQPIQVQDILQEGKQEETPIMTEGKGAEKAKEKEKKRKEEKHGLKARLPKPNRGQEAVRKPYKFQTEKPSFLERNNMFLTQVEEEVKLVKAGKEGKKGDGHQKVFNDEKCQEIENTYGGLPSKSKDGSKKSKPKIVQPVVGYRETKRVNLSKYDNPDFDAESESKKIPQRLLKIITQGPENIVFRALCQESMLEYPKKVVGQVISDLKVYLNTCVKKNMIGEGSYVQCIIENIKMEREEQLRIVNCESKKVAEKIEHVESQYAKRKVEWQKQKNILEVERDLAIQDLELKFEEDSIALEDEWNSEKVQGRYNKPSAKLISMRQHAKALINAHLFEDASVLASMINKQEREEVKEASVRMNREYRSACDRLKDKLESDKRKLDEAFNSKRNGLLTSEQQDLRPLESRIESLKKLKTNTEISEKRNAVVSSSMKKKVPVAANVAPITLNSKLKLPPLKAAGRRSTGKKSVVSNKPPSERDDSIQVVEEDENLLY